MKINKIIIFGGCGKLGDALVKKILSETSFNIIVIDKLNFKKKINDKRVKYLKENIKKITVKKLKKILKNAHTIYYKIGKLGEPKKSVDFKISWDFILTNSIGFWKVVKVAEKMNINKIIVDSSIASISDINKKGPFNEHTRSCTPPNFYGLSKAILEDICVYKNINSRLQIIIIRYPRVYYPDQKNFLFKLSKQILIKKSVEIYGNYKKYIELIHIDDATEFAYRSMNYKGNKKIFNVTYNKCLTLNQILKQISKKLKLKIKLKFKNKSITTPRESNKAFLKDTYSSKVIKIKFKYNMSKIIDEVISHVS
jgi:nucleoside-diphosphate-sugar epimerase